MRFTYKREIEEDVLDFLDMRHELAIERLKSIRESCEINDTFYPFFNQVAMFLCSVDEILASTMDGSFFGMSVNKKINLLNDLYIEVRPRNYENSFLNPAYAVRKFGKEIGQILSALYAEMRSCIIYAYDQKYEQVLMREEFFLQIYGMYLESMQDGNGKVSYELLREAYRNWVFDYLDEELLDQMSDSWIRTDSMAKAIVMKADLSDEDYLYDYGEYISENEIKMARFMATLSQDEIDRMADTYTEGYRKGFIATGKDLSIKKYVEIRYFLGFERVVRKAVENFGEMGLESVIHYSAPSFIQGRNVIRRGIEGSIPNKQFEADHEHDKEIYFDNGFMERKLESYRDVLESIKEPVGLYAGPAVIESFGEDAFVPAEKEEKIALSSDTKKRLTRYSSRAGEILNRYIKGEERSFTIISFPTPAIGDNFEDIFKETIEINTLDYEKYLGLQQIIIDALDKAEYVKILGKDGNKTDLKVGLVDITEPDKETKFENCVADVNIPVGEVFTTPRLETTEGILHVKEVYLNGIKFVDLALVFKSGIIDNISCGNYADEKANKKFLDTYLLFNHETLPLGEFAIGTNTVAYRATKRFGLEAIMPILIAEKTGPHFAVGDSCYSHEEEVKTYNPNGKEIVAKENRYSLMRDSKPEDAYFNCHTDITIPYDELGSLVAVCHNGEQIEILRDGRFVLEGLEELNKSLDEI